MDDIGNVVTQKTESREPTSPPNVANDARRNAIAAVDEQTGKLNHLIDLVGELVIAGASANLLAQRSGQSALAEANSLLSRLIESIRDAALQLRMVKIGETFETIQRTALDAARMLNKDIELIVTGAATELDKSVVEKVGAPLMQWVHNALHHGIESAEVRLTAGKASTGRVELNAFHDSGSIVIEVTDDGEALNAEHIQTEALERGLIQSGQTLTNQELIALIFEPGFSGRGVGMDAVSKGIAALRGTVEVTSEPEGGAVFSIRLPLTLAIIDGFLTGVDKSFYVIPLDKVIECIELNNTSEKRDYLNLRGEVLPFVRLRDLFEVPGPHPVRENIVVVQYDGQKAGVVVDQLLGEFQTVIKPLGRLFTHAYGISGSTILGSGEVALILDVQALVSHSACDEESSLTHSSTDIHL